MVLVGLTITSTGKAPRVKDGASGPGALSSPARRSYSLYMEEARAAERLDAAKGTTPRRMGIHLTNHFRLRLHSGPGAFR